MFSSDGRRAPAREREVQDGLRGAVRWGRRTILVAVLASTLIPGDASASAGHAGPVVVDTDRGVIRGSVVGSMTEFLGVPYAAAPVGDLRWRPPQPHARWRGVRDATTFGAHCPQGPSPFGI